MRRLVLKLAVAKDRKEGNGTRIGSHMQLTSSAIGS